MVRLRRNRKLRGLISVFVAVVMVVQMVASVSAQELASGTTVRWGFTRAHTSSGRMCLLRFHVAGGNTNASATSRWRTAAVEGAAIWNSRSNNRISTTEIAQASNNQINVAFGSFTNANVPAWMRSEGIVGYARLWSATSNVWVSNLNGTIQRGNFTVQGAELYSTPAFESINNEHIRRAVAIHEMGHAVGMGHPSNRNTSSIMQGSNAEPGFEQLPQPHDIDVLNRFYG
ncbi:MAG: hypothetical protein FWF76_01245 [Oscillospiraceae bacterium]|nr:hypothetical protein [Oscillospiraceae bacterium]